MIKINVIAYRNLITDSWFNVILEFYCTVLYFFSPFPAYRILLTINKKVIIKKKEIKKTILFIIASKKDKIQGGKRFIHLKLLRLWWKKQKNTQINGKIFHALGLEELILVKRPYYPKQSTDLVRSLLNYPWHVSQK